MKKYKHLVFDIDGTLMDTVQLHMESLRALLKELTGKDVPEEELTFTFGIPGLSSLAQLGISDVETALEKWVSYYQVVAERLGLKLFPGIREALEQLYRSDVKLGIITSKLRVEYDTQFLDLGIADLFETVITSSDTPMGKPYPDPMYAYLEKTGADKEEVLYFGDTVYDMDCARSAGVDQALALWGCLMPDGIEATYRLKKPEDILEFI